MVFVSADYPFGPILLANDDRTAVCLPALPKLDESDLGVTTITFEGHQIRDLDRYWLTLTDPDTRRRWRGGSSGAGRD